ncbi:MAG TPA: LEA type 2 family protein [Gemmatimonadales bacterium]|nr:LEA type 2 family protein [Gemmatimonadales bacterium]
MSRWTRWLPVTLLAAGCATLGQALRFQEPDIRLQEIRVTGLGLTGGTLDLALDVFNPNDYRLRTTRLELGIDLEDVHFGDALLETPLELPSQQHSLVIVPVQFEWAGVGAGARALLSRQAIRFGLTGVASLGTPVGDRRVQVHGTGEVPLKALLR